jgi:hypothetical protein
MESNNKQLEIAFIELINKLKVIPEEVTSVTAFKDGKLLMTLLHFLYVNLIM